MLDSLRASKGGLITWLFLGAIIIVFVISFGPGSFAKGGAGCGGAQAYAAQVNGKTIPAVDWERQYEQLMRFYQARAGEAFTRELADQLGVAHQALSALIERELVVQEAQRRGIVVTDDEISRAVQATPSFQENGKFVYEAYEEAVRRAFGSPSKYEAALRADLLAAKMYTAVQETVKVSAAEIRQVWAAGADRASLEFVLFPSAAAAAEMKPGEAEVQAFAKKEGARIEAFYKGNTARFDQKKKVRVRHILAQGGERGELAARGDQGVDDAAAKKRIEEAAARVKKGEDFGKVAAELSDDPNTKDRGGDLGFFSEGLADPAFEKAALALEKGQVSEPIRSASGWHLIRVDEVIPARHVPLEAARLEIARELLVKDLADALVKERAQAALDAARKGKTLAELFPAAAAGKKAVTLGGQPVVAQETGPFASGGSSLPKLGPAPDLAREAFAAAAGEVLPRVYQTPAGAVVAAVKSRERPDEKAFETQREDVARRLRNEKEVQVRQAFVAELRKHAKVVENRALLGSAGAEQQPE
jgi:peptidyl-prolyl cis-trans isomerase D